MSEWISVDDRLPEKSGDYRIKYKSKDGKAYSKGKVRYNHSMLPWLRYWSDDQYVGKIVLEWMPNQNT